MIHKMNFHIGVSLIILNVGICIGQNPPVISNFLNGDIKNHAIELKKGTKVSLECDGRGTPNPTYKWFQNDEEIFSDVEGSGQETKETIVLSSNNKVLTFVGLETNYKGFYHCEAHNEHGTAKSEVIYATDDLPIFPDPEGYTVPEFTEGGPKPQLVPFEQQTTLVCAAKGDPTPDITWTRDGKIINPQYEIVNRGQIKLDHSTNSLTVNSVNEDTVGTYACNATNRAGYVYKSVPLNILKQPPVFVEKPFSKNISIGMKGIMRCSVHGYPKPTTAWKVKNEDVNLNNAGKVMVGIPKYEVMPDGGLTINSISEEDAGSLTCTATNSEGEISGKFRKYVDWLTRYIL